MPGSAAVPHGSYYFVDPPNTISSGAAIPGRSPAVLYRIGSR